MCLLSRVWLNDVCLPLKCSLPAQPAEAAEIQVRTKLSVKDWFCLLGFPSGQQEKNTHFEMLCMAQMASASYKCFCLLLCQPDSPARIPRPSSAKGQRRRPKSQGDSRLHQFEAVFLSLMFDLRRLFLFPQMSLTAREVTVLYLIYRTQLSFSFLLCVTRWGDVKWMIAIIQRMIIYPGLTLLCSTEPSTNSQVSSHRRQGFASTTTRPPGERRWFFGTKRRDLQVCIGHSILHWDLFINHEHI